MALLIFFFVLSITFSFLCSIWEAVLLSITPAYISRQGHTSTGRQLKSFKEDIDRPLSAILTLNTIAHTVGAIGVGAQAGKIFGQNSWDLGIFSLSYESVIAGVMTLAILILSEIIPKTIGANMWQSLAPFTIRSLKILILILSPLVWLSQRITKTLKKDKARSVLSRADLSALAMTGAETGALAQGESAIIQNLLKLEKLQVRDIMTPRTVMVTANEEENLKEFWDRQKPLPFSRVPVYQEKSDHITGMILKDQLLAELAENRPHQKLRDIRLPVAHVRDQDQLHKLLDQLVKERSHMAIVNDDFGSVVGLVSMEDLFETLLGLEIVDETDAVEDLRRLARQQWEQRAAKKNSN